MIQCDYVHSIITIIVQYSTLIINIQTFKNPFLQKNHIKITNQFSRTCLRLKVTTRCRNLQCHQPWQAGKSMENPWQPTKKSGMKKALPWGRYDTGGSSLDISYRCRWRSVYLYYLYIYICISTYIYIYIYRYIYIYSTFEKRQSNLRSYEWSIDVHQCLWYLSKLATDPMTTINDTVVENVEKQAQLNKNSEIRLLILINHSSHSQNRHKIK